MIYLTRLRDLAAQVALWVADQIDQRVICRWPNDTDGSEP